VDVLVIGGGPAGLAAAIASAEAGAQTMLLDEGLQLGGSLRTDPRYGHAAVEELLTAANKAGVQLKGQTAAISYDQEGGQVTVAAEATGLLRIHAKATVHATGSYAQNIPFGNNDRPGVIAMRGAGRLLLEHGITPAESVCLVGEGEASNAMKQALQEAGIEVHTLAPEERLLSCEGKKQVEGVTVEGPAGRRKISVGMVIIGSTPAPASELARQQGAHTHFTLEGGGFAVQADAEGGTNRPGVFACGDVCGYVGPEEAGKQGCSAGKKAAAYAKGLTA
jgi:sarcosine oxidase subunit alpha